MYKNRINKPFEDENELIAKIKSVWHSCASNLKPNRKSMKEFTGRLQAIKVKNGASIKVYFEYILDCHIKCHIFY